MIIAKSKRAASEGKTSCGASFKENLLLELLGIHRLVFLGTH